MELVGKSSNAARGLANFLIALTITTALLVTQFVPVLAGAPFAPVADTTGLPALPRTLWSDTDEPALTQLQDVGAQFSWGVAFTPPMTAM